MPKKKKLPKSIRKFIAKEKSRIRRQTITIGEKQKQISELYQNFSKKEPNKEKKEKQTKKSPKKA